MKRLLPVLVTACLWGSPAVAHESVEGAHAAVPRHHAGFAAGRPGDPARTKRTIRIQALDTMRFNPSSISVRRGETVRLVFSNSGRLPHEAVIGSRAEQRHHEAEMQAMQDPGPAMAHHHPNAVSLEPGETRELAWQFAKAGRVEIGCHLPGHYAAGMVGKIIVR